MSTAETNGTAASVDTLTNTTEAMKLHDDGEIHTGEKLHASPALSHANSQSQKGLAKIHMPHLHASSSSHSHSHSRTHSDHQHQHQQNVPVDPHERNLDVLLAAKSSLITQVQAELKAKNITLPAYFDSIWILRHIMSFEKTGLASIVESIKKAVDFRNMEENKYLEYAWVGIEMDDQGSANSNSNSTPTGAATDADYHKFSTEWLQHKYPPPSSPDHQLFKDIDELLIADIHGYMHDGGILLIIRSGISHPSKAIQRFGTEKVTRRNLYRMELVYRQLDRISRKLGRLVKATAMQDMMGVGLRTGHSDRSFMKALGDSSHISEFCHPGFLDRMVVVHPPSFFKALFAVVKLFMSAKTLEKFQLCSQNELPGWKYHISHSEVQDADAIFDYDQVPTFLGGNCECKDKGGCILGVSNDQKVQIDIPSKFK